ncbi:hypothetical protein B0H17DRAFT_1136516 [Mycena rosella]|uniref:Uncharacterized protein n=1 Tax=Mycena rosella TaxID=1033263 RepID=A0AAD7DAW8_MYCRO|nr:hypothetical protein B0H17DRAFT_1136516 [Mycena rosella]
MLFCAKFLRTLGLNFRHLELRLLIWSLAATEEYADAARVGLGFIRPARGRPKPTARRRSPLPITNTIPQRIYSREAHIECACIHDHDPASLRTRCSRPRPQRIRSHPNTRLRETQDPATFKVSNTPSNMSLPGFRSRKDFGGRRAEGTVAGEQGRNY